MPDPGAEAQRIPHSRSVPVPSMLLFSDIRYAPEAREHDADILDICEEAFGPGRFARAAERVREMAPHAPELSFVALIGDAVVGAVRQVPISIGGRPALMLGPLAVRPGFKGRGAGRALMRLAAQAAREAGESATILVGDAPYYAQFGYRALPEGSVLMPGPVDPRRLLGLALREGGLDGLAGRVGPRR